MLSAREIEQLPDQEWWAYAKRRAIEAGMYDEPIAPEPFDWSAYRDRVHAETIEDLRALGIARPHIFWRDVVAGVRRREAEAHAESLPHFVELAELFIATSLWARARDGRPAPDRYDFLEAKLQLERQCAAFGWPQPRVGADAYAEQISAAEARAAALDSDHGGN